MTIRRSRVKEPVIEMDERPLLDRAAIAICQRLHPSGCECKDGFRTVCDAMRSAAHDAWRAVDKPALDRHLKEVGGLP